MPVHRTPGSIGPARGRSTSTPDDTDDAASPGVPRPVLPYVPRSAGPRRGEVRWSRCSSCRRSFVAASLVAGECQSCAGLQPLPLRGEGGRFLPGLSHGPAPSPSRTAGSVQSSRRTGGSR